MRHHIRQICLAGACAFALLPFDSRAQGRADTLGVTSIATLKDSLFPVTGTASATEMLAGKVPGLTALRLNGAPGALTALEIRARLDYATYSAPLYVVDGVMLTPSYPLSTNDIEALDVESISVLKGAAAGAAYGFRGGAGVVVINTRRGRMLPTGKLQLSARSEIGPSLSYGTPDVVQAHAYRVNSAGQYVNAAGLVVPRDQRVFQTNLIRENRYIVPTYDHSDQFFQNGLFNTQSLSAGRNGTSTNFNLGYTRNDQPGNVLNADGVERHSARFNGDYRWNNRLKLGVSASYMRSNEEPADVDFRSLSIFEADVDLLAPGTGIAPYIVYPDPQQPQLASPFFSQVYRKFATRRSRVLFNANAEYDLLSWLRVNAGASHDRGAQRRSQTIDRGELDGLGRPSTGFSSVSTDSVESTQWRAGIGVHKAARNLVGRASLHADSWREWNAYRNDTGTDFTADGTPQTKSSTSSLREVTTNGVVANAGIAYGGRYILDILGRRERSTATVKRPSRDYSRASLAWVMERESWFPFTNFDRFKLRFNVGTAGSDTRTLIASDAGLSAGLTPNIVSEREFAIETSYRKRIEFQFAYSAIRSRLTSVIIYTGPIGGPVPDFDEVYDRISGNTVEGALKARILSKPNGTEWSVSVVGDRSRSKFADFDRACFTGGYERFCAGTTLGSLWGGQLVRNRSALPSIHASSAAAFDVNDEGYVVPVGAGNSWRDGKTKNLWGSSVVIDGRTYPWGLPIIARDNNGQMVEGQIGDGNADLQFGIQNFVRFRGFTLYAQVAGQIGGDTYNNAKQSAYGTGRHVDADQSGRPDELRKPFTYYRALAGDNANYLANFAEDATHARLSEASVGYTFSAAKFGALRSIGAERLQIELVGRNLFTLTGYSGGNVQGVSAGTRFDDVVYPRARTFTVVTRLVF